METNVLVRDSQVLREASAACERAAEACFVAANACRSKGARRDCLHLLEDCRALCDAMTPLLREGEEVDCSVCAQYCAACCAATKTMTGPEFRDCFIACGKAQHLFLQICTSR